MAWDTPAKVAGNTVVSTDWNNLVKTVKPFQSQGMIYATPMSDHDYYGNYCDAKSGEAVAVMAVVYLNQADNKWYKAKADYSSTLKGMLGLAVSAAAGADTQFVVLLRGIYRDDSFTAFTAGTDCYVSTATAGLVTQTLGTSGTILVRRIGYAQDTKILVFDPESNIHTEVLHTGVYFGNRAASTVVSQDNSGVERKFFKDDFSNDTLSGYTTSGSCAIASGELTFIGAGGIEKPLPTCTTGKWSIVAKYTTAWVSGVQEIYMSLGTSISSYFKISRGAGNTISTMVYVNTTYVWNLTSTAQTLADNTYATFEISYDGTTWTANIYGLSGGTYTKSIGVVTSSLSPSVGIATNASSGTTVYNEITYVPSVAYTDLFAADSETRYMQLSSTDLITWVASAAGDVVIGGGTMTLASNDDQGIMVVGRSYNYGSGSFKLSFVDGGDGGGTIDSNGMVFGYQDSGNFYRVAISDTVGVSQLLTIRKYVAGAVTTLYSAALAGYTKGNQTWIETQFSRETGTILVYIWDNAATKPTTPNATVFDVQYMYGKFGVYSNVTVLGAGNLSTAFDNLEVRANLLIGETNVPATESGFYLRDEFAVDSTGRYSQPAGRYVVTGGYIHSTSPPSSNTLINPSAMLSTSEHEIYITPTWTGASPDADIREGLIAHQLQPYTTDSTAQTAYMLRLRFTIGTGLWTLIIMKATGAGFSAVATSGTISITKGAQYKMKLTISSGVLNGYIVAAASSYGAANATYTDPSPLLGGYAGFIIYDSATGSDPQCDNWTVSGTRYYMKPMLRGAQIGEYYVP